jgi:predicted restriction endonuclease
LGLLEPLLLGAAHIVSDKDERLGKPEVPNGIPLSNIHHAAFDAHLISIAPTIACMCRSGYSGKPTGRCSEP